MGIVREHVRTDCVVAPSTSPMKMGVTVGVDVGLAAFDAVDAVLNGIGVM